MDGEVINDTNTNTHTNNCNNLDNTINGQRHNQNTIEEQITTKIYNSDISRNNKTMLNVQLENKIRWIIIFTTKTQKNT